VYSSDFCPSCWNKLRYISENTKQESTGEKDEEKKQGEEQNGGTLVSEFIFFLVN